MNNYKNIRQTYNKIMKQILIVRVNKEIYEDVKQQDKISCTFRDRFSNFYDVIFDYSYNNKYFNGVGFKLEIVK